MDGVTQPRLANRIDVHYRTENDRSSLGELAVGFFLLIIAGLVAWFFISAASRAKMRMAYADQRAAERELDELTVEPHLKPTWALRQDGLREFAYAAGRLCERRGVPLEFFQHLSADDGWTNGLMHYIALLERRGNSFTAQKIAAADYVVSQWFLIPSPQQGEFMTAQLKRKLGG
jgi:hypothetical protein